MRLIDADALIEALNKYGFWDVNDRTLAYKVIQLQPTVQPDPDTVSRPKGHWTNVSISVSGDSTADCSRCGATVHNSFADTINYCPNCGADMRQQEGGAV